MLLDLGEHGPAVREELLKRRLGGSGLVEAGDLLLHLVGLLLNLSEDPDLRASIKDHWGRLLKPIAQLNALLLQHQ